jgi:hypothetical protein
VQEPPDYEQHARIIGVGTNAAVGTKFVSGDIKNKNGGNGD